MRTPLSLLLAASLLWGCAGSTPADSPKRPEATGRSQPAAAAAAAAPAPSAEPEVAAAEGTPYEVRLTDVERARATLLRWQSGDHTRGWDRARHEAMRREARVLLRHAVTTDAAWRERMLAEWEADPAGEVLDTRELAAVFRDGVTDANAERIVRALRSREDDIAEVVATIRWFAGDSDGAARLALAVVQDAAEPEALRAWGFGYLASRAPSRAARDAVQTTLRFGENGPSIALLRSAALCALAWGAPPETLDACTRAARWANDREPHSRLFARVILRHGSDAQRRAVFAGEHGDRLSSYFDPANRGPLGPDRGGWLIETLIRESREPEVSREREWAGWELSQLLPASQALQERWVRGVKAAGRQRVARTVRAPWNGLCGSEAIVRYMAGWQAQDSPGAQWVLANMQPFREPEPAARDVTVRWMLARRSEWKTSDDTWALLSDFGTGIDWALWLGRIEQPVPLTEGEAALWRVASEKLWDARAVEAGFRRLERGAESALDELEDPHHQIAGYLWGVLGAPGRERLRRLATRLRESMPVSEEWVRDRAQERWDAWEEENWDDEGEDDEGDDEGDDEDEGEDGDDEGKPPHPDKLTPAQKEEIRVAIRLHAVAWLEEFLANDSSVDPYNRLAPAGAEGDEGEDGDDDMGLDDEEGEDDEDDEGEDDEDGEDE